MAKKIFLTELWPFKHSHFGFALLSTPMCVGVDYVVIGFDMEVQPLVTHNAA